MRNAKSGFMNLIKNIQKPVLFFDGVCGLCNKFINFAISQNKNENLFFSTLQGCTAKSLLPQHEVKKPHSIILYDHGQIFKKSDAVIKSFVLLGWPWKIFYIFKIVPKFFRDNLYNFIAKNRYKWFGKKESCRLLTESEKDFFLP